MQDEKRYVCKDGRTKNEQQKTFYESRKEIFEHFGETWEMDKQYSICEPARNAIELLGYFSLSINPKRKTRLIIDYDPDFPEALIQVKEG